MKCPTSRVIPWTVEAHAGAEWAAPAGDTGPGPRESQVCRQLGLPASSECLLPSRPEAAPLCALEPCRAAFLVMLDLPRARTPFCPA